MAYTNFKTKGTLEEITGTNLIEKSKGRDKSLISPQQVFMTRVTIKRPNGGTHSTEVFGAVPQNYLGKNVEIVTSYQELPGKRELLYQQFYVDGKLVINQPIVKKA